MKQKALLGIIRAYWRATPRSRRTADIGTSIRAYNAIHDGAGIGAFISAALPLRMMARITGYGGEPGW